MIQQPRTEWCHSFCIYMNKIFACVKLTASLGCSRAANRRVARWGGTGTAQGHASIAAVSTGRQDRRSVTATRQDGRCITADFFNGTARQGFGAVAFPTVVEFGAARPSVRALAARRRHAVAADKSGRKVGTRLFKSQVSSGMRAAKGAAALFLVQFLLAVTGGVVNLQSYASVGGQ